jgi:hypothetical protein
MSVRAKILNQQPYGGVGPSTPSPELEEISDALAEVIAGGGITDRDAARIAAFAWYYAVESETVLDLFRTGGTRRILQQELGSHSERPADLPQKIPSRGFRHLSEFSLAKELDTPELGWAVAVLKVAEASDFRAIVESLGSQDDPSRIASYFIATPRFIPPQERPTLIAKLLSLGDPISLEVAIALFSCWLESALKDGEMDIAGVFAEIEENASVGAVLLGSVLGSTQRYQSPPCSEEVARRATEMERRIDEAGKRVFANARAVNNALNIESIRYLDVLAAMSRWRNDPTFAPAASKAIRCRVAQFLESEFSNRQNLNNDDAGKMTRVTKWSIEPLVQITLHDGIEVEVFHNYFNALATDSFSQMTRHRAFLEDRQRAILLLAVAGLVAHKRIDASLLEAVRSAANRLILQPAGVVEVVDTQKRQEIEDKCGFSLPEQ